MATESQGSERSCLFCGSRKNLTGEHLWPRWLNKVLPNYRATSSILKRPGEKQRTWPTKRTANQEIGMVCDPCNSRWMSQLETAAQPLLTEMIRGRRQTLDKPQQRTLAAWAFKTAIVGERMSPKTAVIPQKQRYGLKEAGEPPIAAQVFIAATDGQWPGDTHFAEQKLLFHRGGTVDRRKGYATTMLIQRVALQVVGHAFEDATVAFYHRPPLRDSVRRIWPFIGPSTWPPGPILDTGATLDLTQHWRRPLPE